MRQVFKWAVVVVLLAALGVGLAYALAQGEANRARLDAAQKRSDARGEEVQELRQLVDEANRRLRKAGRKPVETDDLPEPDPMPLVVEGPPGKTGLPGQSCIEELGLGACRGPKGAPGEDGQSITGAQGVPGERGPQGVPGPQGEPGKDSTVPGPAGKDGKDGADGKDGQSALPFTFTFDVDGTTYTITCTNEGCVTS